MIDINNITVRIGAKVLLHNASAHISEGQKVGLVGCNGCGKSTLFRVLLGELDTESGDVLFPSGYRVAHVVQEQPDVDIPVLDFVLQADTERVALLKRLTTATDFELAEIHERLNLIGSASAEGRASAILHGLGFRNEDFARPIKEFSGGWRMRLALAAALFQPSEVLLLDEPTNHLDLEASVWLENHLRKYKGTLLLISHDRYILNDLCNYIIHLENCRLTTYSGNYDTFRRTRAMQRELQAKQIAKQDEQRRHLQSYIDRFRYKATKAKQAQSRIKLLEKMEVLAPLSAEASSEFNFPQPLALPSPLITLDDVSVGYNDISVLTKLSLSITSNDRIALLGANGNGKSTFAKLLSSRLPAQNGTVRFSPKLEVGYFAQHQSEELPLEQTACEYMSSLMPDLPESVVRAHLAGFGLNQEKATTTIAKLSGGEKSRLLFAVMTRRAPALLILDEPTNHLDIEGRDALVEALNNYNGAVLLITHDLHLIELVADDLWLIKDHKCRPYNGDLADYKQSLLADTHPTAVKIDTPKPESAPNNYFAVKKLNSDIKRLEKQLDKLNIQKSSMEQQFSEITETEALIKLQKDFSALTTQITSVEEEWLSVSESLQSLSQH